MNYIVAITPPQPIFDELSKVINDLSAEYKGPVFKPHITILNNIDQELRDVQKAVETVVKNTRELTLSLGQVSFGATYFRSVFIKVNLTEQLMQFHLDLKRLLGIENNVFVPHISLMYGNHDMKTREKIASKIKLQSNSFITNKIVIIPEKSKPEEWEPIAALPLIKE